MSRFVSWFIEVTTLRFNIQYYGNFYFGHYQQKLEYRIRSVIDILKYPLLVLNLKFSRLCLDCNSIQVVIYIYADSETVH